MKTILVATDFSPAAANAVDYAAEMASAMHAKLVLFHSCHVPLTGTEIPVEIETMEEIQKRGLEKLLDAADQLKKMYGNQLQTTCVCQAGFATDEINRYAHTKKVDLVVMGMHGAGYLAEKLFGSVTTSVLGSSKCPVLVINNKVKFHMLKKIVLAYEVEKDRMRLPQLLKELSLFFNARLYVLDVVPESVLVPSGPGELTDLGGFIQQFADISHSFHYWKGENVVEGINDFVARKNMDMVVMMPRHRTFIKRLFKPSNTKHMAFHSRVPLLVLPEPDNKKNKL